MSKKFILICLIILMMLSLSGCTKGMVAWYNNWQYGLQKTDDATNYRTIKEVEDTCRAMISSYETDKLTYMQYKDSENKEKQSWAEQAKMRANKTANTYNNYILKNSFVWKDNVPSDIRTKLEIVE
jgi:isopropylmalate/homocitrate/citramalate synthase